MYDLSTFTLQDDLLSKGPIHPFEKPISFMQYYYATKESNNTGSCVASNFQDNNADLTVKSMPNSYEITILKIR